MTLNFVRGICTSEPAGYGIAGGGYCIPDAGGGYRVCAGGGYNTILKFY